MEFVPNEKATPIRYPSTANLMVDSKDRNTAVYPKANDFLITKNESMMNGFFTRVGTTEVVFEWGTPNVNAADGLFTYTVGGLVNQFAITGFFTAAELIDAIKAGCNTFTATGVTWATFPINGSGVIFMLTGGVAGQSWTLTAPILRKLDISSSGSIGGVFSGTGTFDYGIYASDADLRPTRYLDITCSQLTNNQAVKDGSTAKNARDVLCRWYFDYDNQNPPDKYGFPVLMGYYPFCLRRIFNPPKQIQWQTNAPIGQMAFQVYGDDGNLSPINAQTNFLMTLQASEV